VGVVADLVNPLLAVCVLLAPRLSRRPGGRFLLRALLAVAAAYAATFLDRQLHLWAGLGLDFSTHTAVAVALALSLVAWNRRWLAFALPVLAGYAALMIRLHYHSLADILTTAAVVAPLAWLCHRVAVQRPVECQSSSP